jgi:hypothetical protein
MASTKERAWLAAHEKGSKALIAKLDKAHAKNPEYQAFKQKHGLGNTSSVKQVSKSQVDVVKQKAREKLAAKAYGATKGTRMGAADGSGETLRDTIAPLSPEQHSAVKSAERTAKAAAKPAKPKKEKKAAAKPAESRLDMIKRLASRKKINNPPVSAKQLRTIAAVGGQEHDHGGFDDLSGTGYENMGSRSVDEGNNYGEPYNNDKDLNSKSNTELQRLHDFWKTRIEKNPNHSVAKGQLAKIKAILAGKIGKKMKEEVELDEAYDVNTHAEKIHQRVTNPRNLDRINTFAEIKKAYTAGRGKRGLPLFHSDVKRIPGYSLVDSNANGKSPNVSRIARGLLAAHNAGKKSMKEEVEQIDEANVEYNQQAHSGYSRAIKPGTKIGVTVNPTSRNSHRGMSNIQPATVVDYHGKDDDGQHQYTVRQNGKTRKITSRSAVIRTIKKPSTNEEVEQIDEMKMSVGTIVKLKKPIDGHGYARVKGFTSSSHTRGPTGRGVPMPAGKVTKVHVALKKTKDDAYDPGPNAHINQDDIHSVVMKEDATSAMSDKLKKKNISDKDKTTLAKLHALMSKEKAKRKPVSESYDKAEKHIAKAAKALETSDMEAYHQHMSNHHEELGKWHESKGRGDLAQRSFDKAEKHHEMSLNPDKSKTLKSALKIKNMKEEVWDEPNPKENSKALSPSQKARAKARARAAGRSYPNLVDNMWASKLKEGFLSKLLGKKPVAKPKTKKTTGYQGLPAEWNAEKRGNEYYANQQMAGLKKEEAMKDSYEAPFEGGKTPSKNKGIVAGKSRPEGMSRVAHLARLALKKKAMKEGYMKANMPENDDDGESDMAEYERQAKKKGVRAYDKNGKLVGNYRSMEDAKKFKPGHTYKEEVEQIDEDALKAREQWMKAKGVSTGNPKADRARKVKRLMKSFPMKKEEVTPTPVHKLNPGLQAKIDAASKKQKPRQAGTPSIDKIKLITREEKDYAPVAPVPGDKWKLHAIMVHPETKQRVVVPRKNVGNYPKSDGWKEVAPGMRKEEVEQLDEVISAKERKWREAVIDRHGDTVRFKKKRHEDDNTYHTVAFKGNNDKYVGNFVHSGKMAGGGVMFPARSGAAGKWTEVSEDVEQIDEISKKKVGDYIKAAANQKAVSLMTAATTKDIANAEFHGKRYAKRDKGITKAVNRLTREEVEQIDEGAELESAKKVAAMPKGSVLGSKDDIKTHLEYLKARHAHLKKFGYSTNQVADKIGRVNHLLTQKEEVEQVAEVLKPSMGAGAYVSDFVHSKNPKFAGKSKSKRIQMALGAYYADKKGMKEGLDPVGKEDADVNNDGKHGDSSDKYLLNRRKKIGQALQQKSLKEETRRVNKKVMKSDKNAAAAEKLVRSARSRKEVAAARNYGGNTKVGE